MSEANRDLQIMSKKIYRILSLFLCFCLIFEQTGFAQIAGTLDISGYFAQLHQSFTTDKFRPLHLRYLQYLPEQNSFRLLIDKGDALKGTGPKKEAEDTTKTLLKYFFIGLSLPNDSFWVNLRPDSPDNIIDPLLAQTDVGKILLEADLQLKKDTARFTSPDTPEGRECWDKLYQKAGELFGTENITISTLTRPWIVPDEIIIREANDNAYIYKATLKVMLEEDYLVKSQITNSKSQTNPNTQIQNYQQYQFKDPRLKELNAYSSQLIREAIIPKLTKEINASKSYAPLRQVYYSLILAQWFKTNMQKEPSLKETVPDLINSKNLANLTSQHPWNKFTYFTAYKENFQKGEYNLKEPRYTPFGQTIRTYFSGGINILAEPTGTIAGQGPIDNEDMPRYLAAVDADFPDRHAPWSEAQVDMRFHKVPDRRFEGADPPTHRKRLLRRIFPEERDRREALNKAELFQSEVEAIFKQTYKIIPPIGIPCYKLASNIMRHGRGGEINVFTVVETDGTIKIEVICTDNGDGMDNPDEFLKNSLRAHRQFIISGVLNAENLPLGGRGFRNIIIYPDSVIIESRGRRWEKINRGESDLVLKHTGDSGVRAGTKISLGWRLKGAPADRLSVSPPASSADSRGERPFAPAWSADHSTAPIPPAAPPAAPMDPQNGKGLGPSAMGGIDLRRLPAVTQSMAEQRLSPQIRSADLNAGTIRQDLEQERIEIKRLLGAGIMPASERIKEYAQAALAGGAREIDKVIACIMDMLRMEEERCCHTEPELKEMLVALEADSF